MNLELSRHIALIVGGASGIGLATAHAFAAEGAHVVLWDRREQVHEHAQHLREQYSVQAHGIVVDIADESSVRTAMERTLATMGSIDHVVHAAAIGSGKFGFPFTNLNPDDWRQVLQVNVMGMTHVAHAVAPVLPDHSRGTIVFIASVAGQIGSQTDPPYSAAKAANINFAQCIAKDLAHRGIRVNTVCPGMVKTPLNQSVWQAWHNQAPPEDQRSYEDWATEKIRAVAPLGEWQTVESIADMIVFLSSVRAAYVTGQTINVDGGQVMHW